MVFYTFCLIALLFNCLFVVFVLSYWPFDFIFCFPILCFYGFVCVSYFSFSSLFCLPDYFFKHSEEEKACNWVVGEDLGGETMIRIYRMNFFFSVKKKERSSCTYKPFFTVTRGN